MQERSSDHLYNTGSRPFSLRHPADKFRGRFAVLEPRQPFLK